MLLALAWAARTAGAAPRACLTVVRCAALGLALLTAGSAWQLVRGARLSLPGMARLDMEPPAALAVLTGALALVAAFGAVALAPFTGFEVNRWFYPMTQLGWLARLDHSHCNSADPLTDGLEVCYVFYRPEPGGAMCVLWW